ncbi:MAG: hypothetical protein R3F51_24700 [Cyanobacteriota/Melainabacteria group bacterium]
MAMFHAVRSRGARIWHAISFRDMENQVVAHILNHSIMIGVHFAIVAVILFFFPGSTHFGLFDFWQSTGTLSQWLTAGIPIFVWAVAVNGWQCYKTYNSPMENRHAERILRGGFLISLAAGVFEETLFRWVLFLAAIVGVQVVNFIFFGFLGFGIPELIFNYILGPVANFFTLGYLDQYLSNPEIWFVGAGLISANSRFRDGHKYQGFLGWVNSWFLGMVFFYMTLTYGLVAAIVVHFLYDMIIFLVIYIDMVIERAQGRR